MATATTMTAEKVQVTEAEAQRRRAKELDRELCKLGKMLRTSAMQIGWVARELREKRLFVVLGYPSEDAYREHIGVARSSWYRGMQVAEGFKRLEKSVFLTMGYEKAYSSLDLPEQERIQPHWVKRAADPNVSDADLVVEIQALLQTGEVKTDATVREERAWLRIRMYAAAKERVEELLDDFCHEHGLGEDRGQALELMLADASPAGAAMLKVISDRVPEMRAAVELLKNTTRPVAERYVGLERFVSRFIVDLAAASG